MPSRLINGQRTAVSPEAKLINGINANTDLSKRGVGLIRGPKSNGNNTNAAWTNTWPATGATLDIDFANDRSFVRGLGQGNSMQGITYTRASNGTYVGSDGLLKGAGSDKGPLGLNLLSSPQNFENWTGQNIIITKFVVLAPDGTMSGSKIAKTSASGVNHEIHNTVSPLTGTYTSSVYAKAGEHNYLMIWESGTTGNKACFDLINGAVGTTSGTPNAQIVNAGNGWWRCSISATESASSYAMSILNSPIDSVTNGQTAGDGVSGIFVWGAQLELGSTATTYYPTNYNTPRFDWLNTPPARNLLTYTGDLSNTTGWALTATTFSNGCLFETATTSTHNIAQNVLGGVVSTGIFTLSVEVFPNGRDLINISTGNSTAISSVNYTFSTNTFSSIGTTVLSYSSTVLSDGYVRITLTTNTASTFRISPSTGVASYLGDVTKGVYIRNPQIEYGSTATPYQYIYTNLPLITPLQAASTVNGYLCEESRTNNLLWCRDATNTVWVSTNTAVAKDQTGIDGVANACSSLTATSANATCIQTVIATSASKTASVYLKRITGTGTIQVTMDGTTYVTVDLSNGLWNRIVMSATLANPILGIKIVTSGDAVALDYGQIELNVQSVCASTPILTTTASVTRAADNANANIFQDFINNSKGTIYANAVNLAGTNGQGKAIASITKQASSTYLNLGFYYDNRSFSFVPDITGGGVIAVIGSNAIPAYLNTIMAVSYKQGEYNLADNSNNTGKTATNLSTIQQNNTTFAIGSTSNGVNCQGYIKRIVYFPFNMNINKIKDIVSQ